MGVGCKIPGRSPYSCGVFFCPAMALRLRLIVAAKTSAGFMYDLTRFTLADMARCGAELRHAGAEAVSLEAAAEAIVRHLYENLRDAKGRACVMVRLYTTQPYAELPAELRDFGPGQMPAQ